ncbi:MAG: lipopolysaccharide biosynthesis protein, partial [Candidatus Hodarchaeota archaeon]
TIFSVSKILLIASFASLTVFGILLSWGIAFLLAVSISILLILPHLYLRYRAKLIIKKKYISHMFRYSIGNYIVGIFGSAPGFLLPLIIVEILSSEKTAYFAVSWMIAYFLFTIPISVSRSLFAEGSTFEKNFKEDLKKAIKFLTLLLSIGIVVVAIGSKEILSIGFGKLYAENAANVLRLFTLSALPVSINTLYTAIKRVEKRTKEITMIYGFIAIGTIGLSVVLLKEVGLIGVPIAWIITQSATTPVTLKGIYYVMTHGLDKTNNIK